jgi:mono/diheme cytochrome c family protein
LRELFILCLLLAGCQQKMARQPSYRPLEPSEFFADGRASRPLVAGTVPRGVPREDDRLLTGRVSARHDVTTAAAVIGLGAGPGLTALAPLTAADRPDLEYVTTFPIRIDRAALERGQQRFDIFCAVCHDRTGNGNGKIVERGYTHPPSYVTDYSRGLDRRGVKVLLRDAPVGYFFEIVTQGYGAMADYSQQVTPEDRWKIISYIRALQLSQHAQVNDLPAAVRQELEKQP